MRKYRCDKCGITLSWRDWEQLAASEESDAELLHVMPGLTIEDMDIKCECRNILKLHRVLICRDCRFSVMDSHMSKARGTIAYKCMLHKNPNGKCFEERTQ